MTPLQAEHNKRDEIAHWDKCWIFSLAGVVLVSLLTLGTWGRVRMLKDDNRALQQQLATEEQANEEVEGNLKKKLYNKTALVNRLTNEMGMAADQFQALNRTMKQTQENVKGAINIVQKSQEDLSAECNGVTLPLGFQYLPEGRAIFPYDLLSNATGLHQLLQSDESLSDLRALTASVERSQLFTQLTYPWLQWTWLRTLLNKPELEGNFTEWGLAKGGSSFFVAGLAKLHRGSLAGFDFWAKDPSSTVSPIQVLSHLARNSGLSEQDARFYDLADPHLSWPENGKKERLAFTHIDSNDYNTTFGVLQVIYRNMVSGGMITIDNFFHPSGGSKKAVEDFFKLSSPGKSPLLFPAFPGFSVVIFKDRFADVAAGDQQSPLDGNFYSFDLIKGHPEIIGAVQQSLLTLSSVHRQAKSDNSVNQTVRCWLANAMQTAHTLHDFVSSTTQSAGDFEVADVFRFLAGSAPFTKHVS